MKILKVFVALLAVSLFAVPAFAQADDCPGTLATCNGAGALTDPTNDATPNWRAGSCTSGNGVLNNWAHFVATDVSARIRTDLNSAGTDSHYVVYQVDQGDICNLAAHVEVGCSEDEVGPYLGDICIEGLTAGQTYVIEIGTWGDYANGTYTLDVECPAPGAVCGDGVRSCVEGDEECDGGDDAACDLGCNPDCTCENLPFPALPAWGLVGLVSLLAGGGALIFRRK